MKLLPLETHPLVSALLLAQTQALLHGEEAVFLEAVALHLLRVEVAAVLQEGLQEVLQAPVPYLLFLQWFQHPLL